MIQLFVRTPAWRSARALWRRRRSQRINMDWDLRDGCVAIAVDVTGGSWRHYPDRCDDAFRHQFNEELNARQSVYERQLQYLPLDVTMTLSTCIDDELSTTPSDQRRIYGFWSLGRFLDCAPWLFKINNMFFVMQIRIIFALPSPLWCYTPLMPWAAAPVTCPSIHPLVSTVSQHSLNDFIIRLSHPR